MHAQYQRFVVLRRIAGLPSGLGIQHPYVDATELKGIAAGELLFPHMKIAGGRFDRCESGRGGRDAVPQLMRLKICDDAAHAADVIAMRVGDGNDVKPADAARPQIRRHDFLANIKI